jgi:hypothetical protein
LLLLVFLILFFGVVTIGFHDVVVAVVIVVVLRVVVVDLFCFNLTIYKSLDAYYPNLIKNAKLSF